MKTYLEKIRMLVLRHTYTDADYASLIIDKRPIIGYYIFLTRKLIIWKSKNQRVVIKSSVEVKFPIMA